MIKCHLKNDTQVFTKLRIYPLYNMHDFGVILCLWETQMTRVDIHAIISLRNFIYMRLLRVHHSPSYYSDLIKRSLSIFESCLKPNYLVNREGPRNIIRANSNRIRQIFAESINNLVIIRKNI